MRTLPSSVFSVPKSVHWGRTGEGGGGGGVEVRGELGASWPLKEIRDGCRRQFWRQAVPFSDGARKG